MHSVAADAGRHVLRTEMITQPLTAVTTNELLLLVENEQF